MNTKKPLLVALLVPLVLAGGTCERNPATDSDSCPPTLTKSRIDGESVCACNANVNGDQEISPEEERNRPLMVAGELSLQGCNSDDWVPEGYLFAFPNGNVMQVQEICKANDDRNTYVSHRAITCSDCDCDAPCVPEGCLDRCGKAASGCGAGEYCAPAGACVACAALGEARPGGPIECGGECGACPDGSMCVDGGCTGLVRCVVAPSGTCSEKAPTWCPIALSPWGGPTSGTPCSCTLSFECNSGCNGTYQTTYWGSIE